MNSNSAPLTAIDREKTWFNTEPLTAEELRGQVVVVAFWTFTCINWLRVHPYLRAWSERYGGHGLTLIGVHTPEFGFESDPDNVRREVERLGVTYPSVLDARYSIWTSFANQYWPALYFLDGEGRIRHHRFGEGDYEDSERTIQRLLAEAGHEPSTELSEVAATGAEAAADWDDLETPETYVGLQRTRNFVGYNDSVPYRSHHYDRPATLDLNEWGLAGHWVLGDEEIASDGAPASVLFQFHARDLNLVMGPPAGEGVRFRVRIDGEVPGESHGSDVDTGGAGIATTQRMYQLIRQVGPVRERTFEIEFEAPGVQVFSFTFG